jgi:hypothetical protein
MRFLSYFLSALTCLALSAGSVTASTVQDAFYYESPRPGAKYVRPETAIIFRPREVSQRSLWLSAIQVHGSSSGPHAGGWIESDDSRTFIFQPHRSFAKGETVTVSFLVDDVEGTRPETGFSYDFSISSSTLEPVDGLADEWMEEQSRLPQPQGFPQVREPSVIHDSYELPGDFPPIDVIVNDNPADGHVFISDFAFAPSSPYSGFLMILENDGTPVFFREMPTSAWDFKKQPNGFLTYYLADGRGYYFEMDNTYTVVDSFSMGNGYTADRHDFQMLPNGHSLMIAYDPQEVDMSGIVEGGDPHATVIGLIVQELDSSKNVVFQWRSWDHIPITDSAVNLTRPRVDYVHGNAVELDFDGHILVSSRHLDEVTKIDRSTGEIIWRMGGKANQFTLAGDTQWFSHQHDIRRLPGGDITLWDNGNSNTPRRSRPVEYALDEANKVATRVWEYRDPAGRFGSAMGSAQRLPNGNTFMSWGTSNPNATEVRPDGTKVYEMSFPSMLYTYRAFRFEWSGVAARPYAWTTDSNDRLMLWFDKFGDETVDTYVAYRGDPDGSMTPVGWTRDHGIPVRNFTEGDTLYLRVKAVDAHGNESYFSNQIMVIPEVTDVPETIAAGVTFQPRAINRDSQGRWVQARIDLPAPYRAEEALIGSIRLNGGVLTAPDWASAEDATTGKGVQNRLHVKFPRRAVVDALPDGDEVEVTVAGYVGDAYFESTDRIKVFGAEDEPLGQEELPKASDDVVRLHPNVPNPFNPVTTIRFDLAHESVVRLDVYSVGGKRIRTLLRGSLPTGPHDVEWDGRDGSGDSVGSGLYFYRLEADDRVLTRKMLLLK